jgi:hypothetical protein
LYAKAKATPAYRFYALYDKIYRKDVLLWAWSCCRANGGSPGVDGQSFAGIEHKGVEVWLEQLAQELRTKTYRPQRGAEGQYSQSGWEEEAAWDTDNQGSCGTDGCGHRPGSDL